METKIHNEAIPSSISKRPRKKKENNIRQLSPFNQSKIDGLFRGLSPKTEYSVDSDQVATLVDSNVVTSATQSCNLPKEELVEYVSCGNLDPKRYASVLWRSLDETLIMNHSGFMKSTGSSSMENAVRAMFTATALLRDMYYPMLPKDVSISMMTATIYLPCTNGIDMNALKQAFRNYIARHGSDNYPGLVVKIPGYKSISTTFYDSGRVVVTGATNKNDLMAFCRIIFDELHAHMQEYEDAMAPVRHNDSNFLQ